MAATPESRSKDALRKSLEVAQAHATSPTHVWWWFVQPGFGQAGAPDIFALVRGSFLAVEAKADPSEGGKAPTVLQLETMDYMRSACYHTHTASSVLQCRNEDDFRLVQGRILMALANAMDQWPTPRREALREALAAIPWRTEAIKRQRPMPPKPKQVRLS